MTTTATTPPVTTDDATDPTTKRAVIIPDALWDDFNAWCHYQRVTLDQIAHHAPGQMPRFEAFRIGTAPAKPHRPRVRPRDTIGLSDREIEVLQLMSEGLTNGEIGQKLFLSEDTIKSHARRVYRKLGVGERGGAVGWGFRHGLLR